jgi:hypothetical protein
MLASEFIKAIQEAGFSYQKVTRENLNKQPNGIVLTSPGLRVMVGSAVYLFTLDEIGEMPSDRLQQFIQAYEAKVKLEEDFANLPEKG